jgi:hypothetical protein
MANKLIVIGSKIGRRIDHQTYKRDYHMEYNKGWIQSIVICQFL